MFFLFDLNTIATFNTTSGCCDDLAIVENLGADHQIIRPNIQKGMTTFDEFFRTGSQVE